MLSDFPPRFPKPDVTLIPSPNFGYYPSGSHGRHDSQGREKSVVGICYHIAAGTRGSVRAWFGNPASQVSAHFLIGRDGKIDQYVAEGDAAWAQGVLNKPSWPLLNVYAEPNLSLIGIEHEGTPNEEWTEEEYQADLALSSYLCERYWIPPRKPFLLGHSELDTVNRPNCPGPNFPWDRLLKDLQARFANLLPVQLPGNVTVTGELRDNHTFVHWCGMDVPVKPWAEDLGHTVLWVPPEQGGPKVVVR